MEDETYDVYLAIYDLSHGMARSLSAQFLGPNHSIDIIPHSGVVVYNREYFFGGGIQMESPTQFRASRGIQPVQILHIGKTRVSQRQFEHWCATVAASDYSPTSYDLLHKNCNNFADFALRDGLRLNSGVPDWVLDVPQTFLSSPLGAMLRPMLQNMQMSAAPVNGGTLVGSTGNPTPSLARSVTTPASNNPWANIPTKQEEEVPKKNAAPKETKGTPLLDSYNRPLLSTNDAAIPLCINKLRQAVDQFPFDNEEKSELIKDSLEQLKLELVAGRPSGTTVSNSIFPFLSKGLSQNHENLPANSSSIFTFSCMLLRLVVLHPPQEDANLVVTSTSLVAKELVSGGKAFTSTAARSMAWCVLSNSFAHPEFLGSLIDDPDFTEQPPTMEQLAEAAIADIVPTRQSKEVRQAASAFLYNLTLHLSSNSRPSTTDGAIPDVMVALLCGVLEGVLDESDDTTKSGRILVAAMVVKIYSTMALQLIIDLGFVELLRNIQDGEKSKLLANELCSLLM